MKKIIIILTAIIFLVFTGLCFAAQKTITTYIRAGNMATSLTGSSGGGDIKPGDFVTNDPTGAMTGSIADNNLSLGNDKNDASGSYIYGGDSDLGDCVDGKCAFGIGLRVYFEFKILNEDQSSNSQTYADGFSFFVINGSLNNKNSTGGAPSGLSMGELLGYGGPGRTDGLGLRPPKMGIEFDTYPNYGGTNLCVSTSRNDLAANVTNNYNNYNNNHMALLLWGDNPTGTTCSGYPVATFDDNRHGAGGTGDNPVNSYYNDGSGGYYAGPKNGSDNWMEDNTLHRFRMEIDRNTVPETSGKYKYIIKAWVDCPSCSADQLKTFADLTVPYNNETLSPKRINRTVYLAAADHVALDKILFGFGFATGGAHDTITFQNFAIYFTRNNCGYGTNPTSASLGNAAQSGNTVNVIATSGCQWTAVSNSPWLTILSGSPGTGNGTVTYDVTANTGPERTGKITIGDSINSQVFTVTQAAAPPPPSCVLKAGTNIVPYNGTNSLTWSVSNGPVTTAAWTTSPGATCGSPNPAGGSCTTAAQTTAGARTYTLTVSNAYGSNSCSTTFYVGCAGYTVYNNTGSRRDFRVTGSACRRVNSASAIPDVLNVSETVTRYSTNNTTCGTAQGSISYTDAMNVDIVPNGGNGDCSVDYDSTDTVSDH